MPQRFAMPLRLMQSCRTWAVALAVLWSAGAAVAAEHDAVDALIQSRKYDEALSRADQFLASKPRDVQMRFLKGVAQLESNRRTEAVATFTQLTQDAPELPEPYNNLAVLHAAQGQYDRARSALEAALRTNPSYATAQENLGDVYARLAGDAYSQALQLGQNGTAVAPKLAVIRSVFPAAGNAVAVQQAPKLAAATASPPVAASAATTPRPAPGAGAPVVALAPARPAAAPATPAPAAAPVLAKPPVVAAASAAVPVASPPAAAPAPAVAQVPAADRAASAAQVSSTSASASATTAAETEAVEKAVRDWAAAWAAQDMKRYLAAYASDFEVPAGGSRSGWEEERRQRIVGKDGIQVQVEQLQISVDGHKAVARFLQRYKADALNVRSRKTLNLLKQGGAWRITREAVGGR